MLMMTESSSFKTLTATHYLDDPDNFCFWLVFGFPSSPANAVSDTMQPVTLNALLQPALKYKPPLEDRVRLAASICSTFSSLYASGWLHKSFRSDNVVFLSTSLPRSVETADFIGNPQVSGFEYSRQESEAQSLDRAKKSTDLSAAIYRHPLYQGEAAKGYRFEYDIYSLGLVLVEIALWMPLRSFLYAKDSAGNSPFASDLQSFHEPEALMLKQLILDRSKKEFPFKVGTTFYSAVHWCLTLTDRSTPLNRDDEVFLPLEFHDKVLIPIRGLKP